jgi:RNA polymerase sigma factor (sigma-70 family)
VTHHSSSNDPVDDRELLARLHRDPAAFEAFYRRHVDRVTGFAVRRCDGPEEVADLVAAVFLAVIESAHRYDASRGEPLGWLFGLAANQLRMQRRRNWRQWGVADRISGQRLLDADDVLRLEERIDAERLAPEVRRAVARLPRGERAVFELVSREGLTPAQAASALAITPTAVRVRLNRARAKLRTELGGALDPDPPRAADRAAPPPDRDHAPARPGPLRPAPGALTTEEVAL